MSDLVGWLAAQWSWVTAAIVIPVTWFLGRVGVLATKRTDAWLEAKADRWAASRKARKVAKAREKGQREHEAMLDRLRSERVGTQFRIRESKDDAGTIVEVIRLDTKHEVWMRPLDTSDDPPATRIKWSDLMKPAERQRHETARYDAGSDDDADGWVRFEPVNHHSNV